MEAVRPGYLFLCYRAGQKAIPEHYFCCWRRHRRYRSVNKRRTFRHSDQYRGDRARVQPPRFGSECFPGFEAGWDTGSEHPLPRLPQKSSNCVGWQDGLHFNPLHDHGHIKFFSVNTLSTILWEAGFENLEFTGVGRFPYMWKGMVFRAIRP